MNGNGTEPDFSAWLAVGIDQGWVTPPFCVAHDGVPYTEEELREDEDMCDVCAFAVRLL